MLLVVYKQLLYKGDNRLREIGSENKVKLAERRRSTFIPHGWNKNVACLSRWRFRRRREVSGTNGKREGEGEEERGVCGGCTERGSR